MHVEIKKLGGKVSMKGSKLILCAVCACITIIAAATAMVIFRHEISEFFIDVRDKVEKAGGKILRRNGEYADFADV